MAETQREAVPRNDAGEYDVALAFLDFNRRCLLKKLEGLTEDQLRAQLVPSDTTLLGLVQHCAAGERWWFAYHVGGEKKYDDIDFSMVVPPERTSEEVIADFHAAVAEANEHLRTAGSPGALTKIKVDGEEKTLRWVLAHVNTELARHVGHADILREQIDGTTGR